MNRGTRLSTSRVPAGVKAATGDAFLVVVEGEVTEPEYLESVRARLSIDSKRFDVVRADGTDPVTIVQEAKSRMKERAKKARKDNLTVVAYDQVWVVFDTERHDVNDKLLPALDQARALKIAVALSNPSLEYWFVLHHTYTTKPFVVCSAVVDYLKSNGWPAYSKKRGVNDYTALVDATGVAVERAVRGRDYFGQPVEKSDPSTSMDLLVLSMNDSVAPSRRFTLK